MIIKLNLSFPSFTIKNKTVEIKVDQSFSSNDIIDWVFKNKKQILQKHGCELNDTELSKALALGVANVKIINE